ncbi:MAG TPA: CRISPR-associated endonuclease Cas1 [Terriglobales bacterium]|nr:CRISPR-associated endonuclease Cas1 [Terriglobales bacterium]
MRHDPREAKQGCGALTARALCGAGLHPSLGLQHHNRYDPFCLANDLMEPFRPIVDRAVFTGVQANDPTLPIDTRAKTWLLAPFTEVHACRGERRTIFDWLARSARSLAAAIAGRSRALDLADL